MSEFPFLGLPNDLILYVISYLDYPDLISLSRSCKQLYKTVMDCERYLHHLRFHRLTPGLTQFIENRPTVLELYHRRILRHRYVHILLQPYIWSRFELFEFLLFQLRKRPLERFLINRPSRSELIRRGILKPVKFENIADLDSDFLENLHKPVLTTAIASKIKKLENYKIEEVLKEFLRKFRNTSASKFPGKSDQFLDKLSFFENFESSSPITELQSGKRKRILRANVIGNKVFFS